jgi:hypothetical protein
LIRKQKIFTLDDIDITHKFQIPIPRSLSIFPTFRGTIMAKIPGLPQVYIHDICLYDSPLEKRIELLSKAQYCLQTVLNSRVTVTNHYNLVLYENVNDFLERSLGLGYIGLFAKRKQSVYPVTVPRVSHTDSELNNSSWITIARGTEYE